MNNHNGNPQNKWIESPIRNAGSELRLFCFPYAGGSAANFNSWRGLLPAAVEMLPVQLPGRGSRILEPALKRNDELADRIVEEMLPVFREKPFAFFGHSMGATLGFEVARRLARRYEAAPMALFVSGRRAPHISGPGLLTYDLPDEALIERLRRLNGTPREVIECHELMQLVLPLIRADFEAVETYKYLDSPPLACPIFALGGQEDSYVTTADVEQWNIHTSAECLIKFFPGGHFFLHSHQDLLLQFLSITLIGLLRKKQSAP